MSDTTQAAQSDTDTKVLIKEADGGQPVVTFVEDKRLGRDPDADAEDDAGQGADTQGQSHTERSRSQARRERQKRMRNEREQRLEILAGVVTSQDQMIKVLARGQQEQALTTLDAEMRNAQLAYQEAHRRKAEAISKGDGVVAAEADTVMRNAERHYTTVQHQANQIRANPVMVPDVSQQQDQGAPQKDVAADRLKEEFLDKHPWIDLSKNDDTTDLVKTIDNKVRRDGFAPNTKDYWDELSERLRENLPHKFTGRAAVRQTNVRDAQDDDDTGERTRRGPPLGGGGRDGNGDLGPNQLRLTPEMVKALDDSGIPLTGGTPDQQKRRGKILGEWRAIPSNAR